MRKPIGRINKLSLLLLAVLAAAVAVGLIIPGSTGTTIEVGAWIAIIVLVLLEVGLRTTPLAANYYGDERNERGSAALERAKPVGPEDEGRDRHDPPRGGAGIREPPPFRR